MAKKTPVSEIAVSSLTTSDLNSLRGLPKFEINPKRTHLLVNPLSLPEAPVNPVHSACMAGLVMPGTWILIKGEPEAVVVESVEVVPTRNPWCGVFYRTKKGIANCKIFSAFDKQEILLEGLEPTEAELVEAKAVGIELDPIAPVQAAPKNPGRKPTKASGTVAPKAKKESDKPAKQAAEKPAKPVKKPEPKASGKVAPKKPETAKKEAPKADKTKPVKAPKPTPKKAQKAQKAQKKAPVQAQPEQQAPVYMPESEQASVTEATALLELNEATGEAGP